MKKTVLLFALTVILKTALPQAWISNLPGEKMKQGTLTFYDIQNAFNEYWSPYDVENGYFYQNGQKMKASGWKPFRRWEWYWETRIDPTTGEFPKTNALSEMNKYLEMSPSGSTDLGSWTSLGPDTSPGGYAGLGRLNVVAFHPTNNNILYVGSPSGGLWKSTDGGNSWTVLTDGNEVLGVSDIVVVQSGQQEIIYIATGDRDGGSIWSLGGGHYFDNHSVGVMKSLDGGNTWSNTGLYFAPADSQMVYRLVKDPFDDNTLFASTLNGLYKTTDGGNSWNQLVTTKLGDIEFKPGSNQIMYATSPPNYIPTAIYRSTDGGYTWAVENTATGVRTELAVSPDKPHVVYAVVSNITGSLDGVYRSLNSGMSFNKVLYGNGPGNNLLGYFCNGITVPPLYGQGSYDMCIAADPNDGDVVYIGGISTWKSVDGGNNWDISNMWIEDNLYNNCGAPVVHADQHYLAFQNGTSVLFECNDGGLYKTTDNGTTWDHLGNGLVTSQIYRLGLSATDPGVVITGLQDNGTKMMSSGSWSDVFPGDGMECLIDYTNSDIQYTTQPNGRIYRTTDQWTTSDFISGGIPGSGHWVTPVVLHPTYPQTIYTGYSEVYMSNDNGANWAEISDFDTSTIRSIAISASNPQYIYASTPDHIFRTSNAGATWTDITSGLPVDQASITYITVKHDDPQTLWVSMGGYNMHHVYESSDAGNTWTDISTSLPNVPVMCVVQNRQNTGQAELYAGTDAGVFVKAGSGDWQQFSSDLPNVVVTELEIYYDDANPANSHIVAATYGRGLWKSSLLNASAGIALDLKAYLEGPFNGSQMNTTLNLNGELPLSQPYGANPQAVWYYPGSESVGAIPNTDIVDWVLVELRDASAADLATSSTIIARKPAFVLNDASIVDIDGSSLLSVDVTISENLFVVVWHRNHLGVMSANPLTESGGIYSYDFSNNVNKVYGGITGHKEIGPGIWGLVGGDGKPDGQIGNGDKNEVWSLEAGGAGYMFGDFSLDAQVNNSDKNSIWMPNSGAGGQVPGAAPGSSEGYECQVPK